MNNTLILAVQYFCNVLYIIILARVILSWFPAAHGNKLVKALYGMTEPILAPIRSIIHKSPLGGPGMALDFSPLIAFFLIQLAQNLLVGLIGRM